MKLLSVCFLVVGLFNIAEAQKKDYVVTIKTKFGDMVAILYPETPLHRANFIKLCKEKFYDSLLFHRVIDGFMIQGGDPSSKHAAPDAMLGSGGPGYTIDAEIKPHLFHERGSLSAARLGDEQNPKRASSGSQFYIVQGIVYKNEDLDQFRFNQANMNQAFQQFFSKPENKHYADSLAKLYQRQDMAGYQKQITDLIPTVEKETGIKLQNELLPEQIKAYTTVGGTPHLDGQYTVFGKVISGLDVIDKIAKVKRNGQDRPEEDVVMMVTVDEVSKKKITKEYGYVYPEESHKK